MILRALVPLAVALLGSGCSTESSTKSILRIVAIPDANKDRLRDDQTEIAKWIKATVGVDAEVVPMVNYNAAVVALASGQADLGWLGGVTTVQAMQRSEGAVMPVVMREKDKQFKSYIIVKGDAPYQTIDDLKGKTFTFGAMNSTSGHVMPRHLLAKEKGIAKAEEFFAKVAYSGDHNKTIADVRDGTFDAGAVNYSTYEKMIKAGELTAAQVRVLWETPTYVDYAWCARKDVDARFGAGTVAKLEKAFVGLTGKTPQEVKVMTANDNAGGVYVKAESAWWDGIRAVMEMPELAGSFQK